MITSSIQDILMMYTWEDDKDFTRTQDIIDYARPKLFDFAYPLYDDNLKEQFETDFIRHFYTREIGSESIALFKHRLQDYLWLNQDKWERLYKSIDDELNPFNNIDLKTIRSTSEDETTDTDKTGDETSSGTRAKTGSSDETSELDKVGSEEKTRNIDRNMEDHVTTEQDTTTNSHADDFTRQLDQETPDERLTITAQDGVGVIDYASHISENKNTNDSEQTTGVTGSSNTTSEGSEKTVDSGSTTGNETGSRNTVTDENETDSRERNRTELEKQLRSFEQALDEHKIGRAFTNRSFVEVYTEYINHFQGLHRLMFNDMEKLFLGVF